MNNAKAQVDFSEGYTFQLEIHETCILFEMHAFHFETHKTADFHSSLSIMGIGD